MSATRERSHKGSLTNYPLTLCRQNGAHTDVLYNASVYPDEGTAVPGVFAVARDVNRWQEPVAGQPGDGHSGDDTASLKTQVRRWTSSIPELQQHNAPTESGSW